MDYYEELGLKRTATTQEIRQAYKVLARLVHPDGQADEQVREMAHRQMQRLNDILATLTNEQSRREYDGTLPGAAVAEAPAGGGSAIRPAGMTAPGSGPRRMARGKRLKEWERAGEKWTSQLPGWAQVAVQNGFWISLAMVLIAVGAWYMAQDAAMPMHASATTEDRPAAVPDKAPPRAEERPAAASASVEKPVHRTSAVEDAQHGAEPARPAQAAETLTAALGSRDVTTESALPVEAPAVKTAAASAVAAAAKVEAAAETFAGNWLYVPDPAESVAPGTYPATYVEFLLAENRGQLSGSYRAHYRVADRAVSPEVSFQAEGTAPAGKSAHLKWTSADGAKGEVDMSLVGPNLMTVSWWSTELGRHATLASGTAKLIRQRTR